MNTKNISVFTLFVALFIGWSFSPAITQEKTSDLDQIKAELHNKEVTFDFNEIPLKDVIAEIRDKVSFNIMIHEQVNENLNPGERKVTITLKDIELKKALKLILDMKGLSAVFNEGVVLIVPEGESENPYLQFYDVRDLVFKLKDFPGPDLQLRDPDPDSQDGLNDRGRQGSYGGNAGGTGFGSGGGSGGGGGGSFLGSSFSESSSDGGDSVLSDTDEFKKIIKANTGNKESWSKSKISLRISSGMLIVKQTEDVHKQIQHLLTRLRGFR